MKVRVYVGIEVRIFGQDILTHVIRPCMTITAGEFNNLLTMWVIESVHTAEGSTPVGS
jgi:hypothetical protein